LQLWAMQIDHNDGRSKEADAAVPVMAAVASNLESFLTNTGKWLSEITNLLKSSVLYSCLSSKKGFLPPYLVDHPDLVHLTGFTTALSVAHRKAIGTLHPNQDVTYFTRRIRWLDRNKQEYQVNDYSTQLQNSFERLLDVLENIADTTPGFNTLNLRQTTADQSGT
jgi:hypothetical protein